MFSKIDVNGEGRHPLYQKLIDAAPTAVAPADSGFYERMASKGRAPLYPDDILWNFEKFLVGRDGKVLQRFSPDMTPEDPFWCKPSRGAGKLMSRLMQLQDVRNRPARPAFW
jgi:glutathione peroxidase